MRKVKRGIFCAQIAVILLLAGMTATLVYSAVVNEIVFKNNLKTGSVQIQVNQYEETENGKQLIGPGQVLANQDVSYIPEVTNIRAASYVRVKVDIVMDEDVPEPVTVENIYGISDQWVKRGEYFYCTKALEPSETAWIFKGFHVPESWNEEMGSGFRIFLTADAVQADHFTPDFGKLNPWGTIEIQEEKDTDSIVYRVAETGNVGVSDNVLTFSDSMGLEANTNDLFRNFGYFMAGNSFEDTLKMVNKSDSPVKISFCTATEQDDLTEQMKLEIKCEGKLLYEGPLSSQTMEDYIELIELAPSDIRDFSFKVSLPDDSDNSYSVLEDQVVWKFKAEKVPGADGTGSEVQTGDDFSLAGCLAGVIAALLVIGLMLLPGKRGNRKWRK